MLKKPALVVILALPLATPVAAQEEEPIITERPGFSSSPYTLFPGGVQVEAGYRFQSDGQGTDIDSHTLPLTLVRLGLVENIELQLGWNGYTWAEAGNTDVDGSNDASVGIKWQLTDSRARLPVSLFAGVSVPIGSDAFSSDEVDPTIGAFWSFRAGVDWFGTVTLSEPGDDTRFANAVGVSLPLTATLGSYVEFYGIYGGEGGTEHYLNGGVTFLQRFNLQLDASVGVGLNDQSADFFLDAGLGYRF